MTDVNDYDIIAAMSKYGGDFVKQLAYLWQRGDSDNKDRIKATWPEYWIRYTEYAILEKNRDKSE